MNILSSHAAIFSNAYFKSQYFDKADSWIIRHTAQPSKLAQLLSFHKVVDFTIHVREAGEEYNEKIKVDPNKRTELFVVPAHPGVDRSDTLHDFKQVS